MMLLLIAAVAGVGAYLLAFPPRARRRPSPRAGRPLVRIGASWHEWLTQAGLVGVDRAEFGAVLGVLAAVGLLVGWLLFGSVLAALACAAFAGSMPIASYRRRRERRRDAAQDAWPRLVEELRIRTGSLGRSIPQALIEVGLRGPAELRPAFEAAQREWQLSTDFERTLSVLKAQLADPTVDIIAETLLVAHEIGGGALDRRLAALAEDRLADLQGRKDAQARQAGARFARKFVLVVPLGMAAAGMSVGEGRHAYQTSIGQTLVLVALAMTGACWVWAGRVMRLPGENRVFGA
jgi:tight adherence protein B